MEFFCRRRRAMSVSLEWFCACNLSRMFLDIFPSVISTYFGIPSPKMAKIKQLPCSAPGRD
jgi:hypothetical protein